MNESGEKVIYTTCASHCGGVCMLKVHVKNGVITKIETDDYTTYLPYIYKVAFIDHSDGLSSSGQLEALITIGRRSNILRIN